MVRRLVQEKQVRGADQRAGDRQALPPAARQRGGRRVGVGEAGAAECHLDARVSGRLVERLVEWVSSERMGEHLGQRPVGREVGVLRHVRQAREAPERDGPGVGRLEPGEDAQQCRFAAAVRADEADPVALVDAEGHVGEERRRAVRLRDSLTAEEERHVPVPPTSRSRSIS